MFMHNSWRPTDGSVKADGIKKGNILIGTEEEFNEDCASDGRLVVSDLTDSWGGEPALNSTRDAQYRMKPLDTWQIGYWRVSTGSTTTDSNSWDVAWRGNHVYLFDMNRGIEILRLKGGGAKASARMRKVTAPSMKRPARFKAVSSLESGDLVCPLFQ